MELAALNMIFSRAKYITYYEFPYQIDDTTLPSARIKGKQIVQKQYLMHIFEEQETQGGTVTFD